MYTKRCEDVPAMCADDEINIGTYYQIIPRDMTRNKNFNITIEKYDRKGRVFAHDHGKDAPYPNGEQCFFILKGKARVRLADEEKVLHEKEIVYVPMGVEHEVWPEADEVEILTLSVWSDERKDDR